MQRGIVQVAVAMLCALLGAACRDPPIKARLLWKADRISLPCGSKIFRSALFVQQTDKIGRRLGGFAAVELVTGRTIWREEADPLQPGRDYLVCGEDEVILNIDGHLKSLSTADGKVLWSIVSPCTFPEGFSVHGRLAIGACEKPRRNPQEGAVPQSITGIDLDTGRVLWSRETPLVWLDTDGIMVALEEQPDDRRGLAELTMLDALTGRVLWQREHPAAEFVPVVADHTIMLVDGTGVMGLGKADGAVVWDHRCARGESPYLGVGWGAFRSYAMKTGVLVANAKGITEWSSANGQTTRKMPWPHGVGPDDVEWVVVDADRLYMRLRHAPFSQIWRAWDGKRWYRIEGLEGAPGTPYKGGVRDGVMVFDGSLEGAAYSVSARSE